MVQSDPWKALSAMVTDVDYSPIVYLDCEMTESESHEVAAGRCEVFSCRCPGRQSANEDAGVILPCGDGRAVLALADGFGGLPAGQQAAELALSALADAIQSSVVAGFSMREGILNGFEQANSAVTSLSVGAATTLIAVEIEAGQFRTYHVGDSMALSVGQRGKIKLQTLSHSPTGYAVEAGLLAESDAMYHEHRHLVSNAVGAPAMRIDVGPTTVLAPRDTLILGSDGLFDNLHLDEIVQTIRKGRLSESSRLLADGCLRRMTSPQPDHPSKPDDLIFMLYRQGG